MPAKLLFLQLVLSLIKSAILSKKILLFKIQLKQYLVAKLQTRRDWIWEAIQP